MQFDDPMFKILHKYTKALSAALGYRDASTRLHSERVAGLAEEIGTSLGLSGEELGILKIAATFHDVGKIGIRDAILLKPTKLDELEWVEMKRHTEIGSKIVEAIELEGSQQAATAIRCHHEHYDGSGYPYNMAGEKIPIYSRIIGIADSYDAMAETRSHHRARSHTEIMDVLESETGHKHDPGLIRIFRDIIECSSFKAATV
ncbi:MAG: HD domain-containing protein [Sulfuritalea sp.]|nr:HD domain-containing protein [Sulfuritalea sp.]